MGLVCDLQATIETTRLKGVRLRCREARAVFPV